MENRYIERFRRIKKDERWETYSGRETRDGIIAYRLRPWNFYLQTVPVPVVLLVIFLFMLTSRIQSIWRSIITPLVMLAIYILAEANDFHKRPVFEIDTNAETIRANGESIPIENIRLFTYRDLSLRAITADGEAHIMSEHAMLPVYSTAKGLGEICRKPVVLASEEFDAETLLETGDARADVQKSHIRIWESVSWKEKMGRTTYWRHLPSLPSICALFVAALLFLGRIVGIPCDECRVLSFAPILLAVGIVALIVRKRLFEVDANAGVIRTNGESIPIDDIRLFTYQRHVKALRTSMSIWAVSSNGKMYPLAENVSSSTCAAAESVGCLCKRPVFFDLDDAEEFLSNEETAEKRN